eukprot:4702354-Pyramimonas_sp.AAC.1
MNTDIRTCSCKRASPPEYLRQPLLRRCWAAENARPTPWRSDAPLSTTVPAPPPVLQPTSKSTMRI